MRSRRRPTAVLGVSAALVSAAPVFALSGNGPPGDIVDAIPVLAVFAIIAILTTLSAISEARR